MSHLHPGPFSTGELYLSSIPVPYHPIHVSRCASQLNPGPISTPSRSRGVCLLSTQAPRFTFLLCLSWILPPSGSWYLHLAYILITSRLHPGPPNCILVPYKRHLKPIPVSWCVSPPSRSFLNWRIVSQLHPSPISPYPRLKMCISTQSRSHLNPIQVSRFVSDLHSGFQIHVSSLSQLNPTSFWVLIFTSCLHPGNISPPFRSRKLHLSSIQSSSQTHTGFTMCLTSIQALSQLKNCISAPPQSQKYPILVSRCASQLNPGPISTPSRSRDVCLLSTLAPKCTFLLCLSWISPQSGSWYLHLASIRVTSRIHPVPLNCILVPSKHHLKPIQVSRCVFHLHPGHFSTRE